MAEQGLHLWKASDGVELAWRETGAGRPVILLHGLFSDSEMNWVRFGHAEHIAAAGYRVITPDLRAHGQSGKPHEPEAYPPGILVRDLKELMAHLGLDDFDLGGFSLGARTVVQAVGEGISPRKAILAGMGLKGLQKWAKRQAFFREAIAAFDTSRRGDPHWIAIQFMKTMNVDRTAASHVLSTFDSVKAEWLDSFTMPTLVVCGTEDEDNGSAHELVNVLPNAIFADIPGTHLSSVTKPELGQEIAAFLNA